MAEPRSAEDVLVWCLFVINVRGMLPKLSKPVALNAKALFSIVMEPASHAQLHLKVVQPVTPRGQHALHAKQILTICQLGDPHALSAPLHSVGANIAQRLLALNAFVSNSLSQVHVSIAQMLTNM